MPFYHFVIKVSVDKIRTIEAGHNSQTLPDFTSLEKTYQTNLSP